MNLSLLRQYERAGKLYSQRHPVLDLTIWNYTQKVQYENEWDEVTLMCRGLVTNDAGQIIARPFPKFFNIEEDRHTPTEAFEIFEKLDGSLIVVFEYCGQMVVASRGSFTSDHVNWATEILNQKYPEFGGTMSTQLTYCFELIHPENRIVVDYGDTRDLVLTGIFHRDGTEETLWWPKLRIVKTYSGLDWRNIKELNWSNAEGFVVKFYNGSRCKIKFENYVRLHRVMTNISDKKIWEALKDGRPISSILENVPDEFFEEIKRIEGKIRYQYQYLESTAKTRFEAIKTASAGDRKRFAQLANSFEDLPPALMFAMLDGRDYSKIIFKYIKP